MIERTLGLNLKGFFKLTFSTEDEFYRTVDQVPVSKVFIFIDAAFKEIMAERFPWRDMLVVEDLELFLDSFGAIDRSDVVVMNYATTYDQIESVSKIITPERQASLITLVNILK
jgi:hypothetical protein